MTIVETKGTITEKGQPGAEKLVGGAQEYSLPAMREWKTKYSEEQGWADGRVPRWPPEKQWAAWALHMYLNPIR